MKPDLREIGLSVQGAWRLLRFDAAGMSGFNISVEGFWRSFFAAVLVAPAFVILMFIDIMDREAPVALFRVVVIESAAYVIGWGLYPVVALGLTAILARTKNFVAFIIAYNWSSVPQMAIYVPAVLVDATGFLPEGMKFSLAAYVAVTVYKWFVARTALQVGGGTAIGVTIMEILTGMFIWLSADRLIGMGQM